MIRNEWVPIWKQSLNKEGVKRSSKGFKEETVDIPPNTIV